MTTKIKPTHQAFIAFIITLLITCSLLIVRFFWFNDKLLGTTIETITFYKLLFFLLCSSIAEQLPISVMVGALFYAKKTFPPKNIKGFLRKSFLQAVCIAAVCFLWIAYIAPIPQLYSKVYLFSIQVENVREIKKPLDLAPFKGYPLTSNYAELSEILDKIDRGEMHGAHPRPFLMQQTRMLAFPILIFIIFYTGFFMGIVFDKNHIIIPILMIFLFVTPLLFFTTTPLLIYFLRKDWNPWWFELLTISIYISIALLFGALSREKFAYKNTRK